MDEVFAHTYLGTLNSELDITFVVFDEKLINFMRKFQEKFSRDQKFSFENVIHKRNEVNRPEFKICVPFNFLSIFEAMPNDTQIKIQDHKFHYLKENLEM